MFRSPAVESTIDLNKIEKKLSKSSNVLPPLYKSFIRSGDPQLPSESSKVANLTRLPHVRMYKTYVGRSLTVPILKKFLEVAENIPTIQSAFISDETPDFVFVEVTNISALAQLFPNIIFETVQPPSIISNFCNVGRFIPQSFCGCMFGRLSCKPFVNESVQILDINYSQKRVILRIVPKLNEKRNGPLSSRMFDPNYFAEKSRPEEAPQRAQVRVSFNSNENCYRQGYIFRDQKYVDGFLIEEVPMDLVSTWSAPLTIREMTVFVPRERQQKFEKMMREYENREKSSKKEEVFKFDFEIPKFEVDDTPLVIERKLKSDKAKMSKSYMLQEKTSSLIQRIITRFENIIETYPQVPVNFPSCEMIASATTEKLQTLLKEEKSKLASQKDRYLLLKELIGEGFEIDERTTVLRTKRPIKEIQDRIQNEADQTAEAVHNLLTEVNQINVAIRMKEEHKTQNEILKAIKPQKEEKERRPNIIMKPMFHQKLKERSTQTTPPPEEEKKEEQMLPAPPKVPTTPVSQHHAPEPVIIPGDLKVGDYVSISDPVKNVKGIFVDNYKDKKGNDLSTIITMEDMIQVDKSNLTRVDFFCPIIFDVFDLVSTKDGNTCIVIGCSSSSKKVKLINTNNQTLSVKYEDVKVAASDSSVYDMYKFRVLPGDVVLAPFLGSFIESTVLGTIKGKAFVNGDGNVKCFDGKELKLKRNTVSNEVINVKVGDIVKVRGKECVVTSIIDQYYVQVVFTGNSTYANVNKLEIQNK